MEYAIHLARDVEGRRGPIFKESVMPRRNWSMEKVKVKIIS
jgi:hypothetical protein